MFGFWFGINLIFFCLAIYWFIEPKFLFPKKQLSRLMLMPIIAIMLFVDVAVFALITTIKHTTDDYDFIGLIIGIIVIFYFGAWRFYRYGQYSILSKLPTQTAPITEPKPSIVTNYYPITDNTITNNNIQNNSDVVKDETQNTPQILEPIETSIKTMEIPLPIQGTPNHSDGHSDTAINQTEKDWQAYKQKMEQSWQETRTKIAKKSRGK